MGEAGPQAAAARGDPAVAALAVADPAVRRPEALEVPAVPAARPQGAHLRMAGHRTRLDRAKSD